MERSCRRGQEKKSTVVGVGHKSEKYGQKWKALDIHIGNKFRKISLFLMSICSRGFYWRFRVKYSRQTT